jgi:hypothetical protein
MSYFSSDNLDIHLTSHHPSVILSSQLDGALSEFGNELISIARQNQDTPGRPLGERAAFRDRPCPHRPAGTPSPAPAGKDCDRICPIMISLSGAWARSAPLRQPLFQYIPTVGASLRLTVRSLRPAGCADKLAKSEANQAAVAA